MSPNLQRSTSPISFSSRSRPHPHYDISRLLDPAYASSKYASTSAYVDRQGELHDPDYRHFPVSHQQPRRRSSNMTVSPSRPRWETFDEEDEEDAASMYPSYAKQQRTRPSYAYQSSYVPHSCDSGDTALDDQDDDDEHEHALGSGVSAIISRTKRDIFTRKRRSLDGASSSRNSSPYYTPTLLPDSTPTSSSSSSSPNDVELTRVHSHHSEPAYPTYTDAWTPLYPTSATSRVTKRHSSASASSHHSANHHSRAQSQSPATQPENAYVPTQSQEERERDREQWTPTCGQALRRQWQAVSLSIRFGLFRAQRRVRTRFAGLT